MSKFLNKIIIMVLVLIPNIKIYAESSDVFESFKTYINENSNNYSETIVSVINEGQDYDKFIDKKVQENKLKIDNKNKTDNKNSSSSSLYGTSNFTDKSSSLNDSSINSWSAINKSYDVYDKDKSDDLTIIATAYTSAAEENGGYEGLNAIGGKLGPGCIAAPKDIPFQTKIRISGLGIFNVEDRGGAIVRISEDTIRVDVWMASYKEAMKFGKRTYKGTILN